MCRDSSTDWITVFFFSIYIYLALSNCYSISLYSLLKYTVVTWFLYMLQLTWISCHLPGAPRWRGTVGCELWPLSAAVACPAKQGSPLCFSGTLDTVKKERERDCFHDFLSTFIAVTLEPEICPVFHKPADLAGNHWESDPVGFGCSQNISSNMNSVSISVLNGDVQCFSHSANCCALSVWMPMSAGIKATPNWQNILLRFFNNLLY